MIKPLPGYVLIEPIEEETKKGDFYVPETSKDKPSKGRVVAVGSLTKEWKEAWGDTIVKPEEKIIFKKWTNQEVEDDGEKYLLVKFDELLGVVE